VLNPDEGQVLLEGTPVNRSIQPRLGYLPEERGLYKNLTVVRMLVYLARLKGLSSVDATNRVIRWTDRLEMGSWRNRRIAELSKGMQQKVQFLSAIIHEPQVLVLDEPITGLDPVNADLIMSLVGEMRAQGRIILFSTHRLEHAEHYCDTVCLLDHGRVILSGSVRNLKRQHADGSLMFEVEHGIPPLDQWVAEGWLKVLSARGPRFEVTAANGMTRPELIAELNRRCELRRIEVKEPGLRDIFVKHVTALPPH
jgi:ABC-2 type transport system ATP-binding protein